MKTPAKFALALSAVLCLGIAGFASFWGFASPERTCLSCHEIRPAGELWQHSAHRDAPCEECHGTALSNGYHSLRQNARRVLTHFSKPRSEDLRLSEKQVTDMLPRCKTCHEREYAGWLASGHSVSYAGIFLNEKHNREEQVNEDCLRCHGMYFEGRIQDVVAPIDTIGPWKLKEEGMAQRPAIPCLTCHQVHSEGGPASRPDYSDPKAISYKRALVSPTAGFYDRRERRHFSIDLLPLPSIRDAERVADMSHDTRDRLCYQCHAPGAEHQLASSDDRTPRGVHEGLSCFACHAPHSHETRPSCSGCHPRLSNCGLDVEKMDTTFAKPGSSHNIHFVGCSDCHIKGVPPRRRRADS